MTSPIAPSSAIGGDRADTGQGHQPQRVVVADRVGGQDPVEPLELVVDEVDLARACLDGQPFIKRQPLDTLGQPGAAADTEQVAHRRALDEVALQGGMDLVLLPGSLAHQRAAARGQPSPRPGRLVGCPHSVEEPDRQQLREHLGIELVGLRSPRGLAHGLRVGEHDPPHRDRQRRYAPARTTSPSPSSWPYNRRRRHKTLGMVALEQFETITHPYPQIEDRQAA